MLHQLRIYEIFEGNKAAFHDRFRDHAARIMDRHGFRILGWRRLMADEEWAEIKRETAAVHGPLVGEIDERVLRAVPYSPGRIG